MTAPFLKAKTNAREYETLQNESFTRTPKNHEERLIQVQNFQRTEHAGKIAPLLIEHFQMAIENALEQFNIYSHAKATMGTTLPLITEIITELHLRRLANATKGEP